MLFNSELFIFIFLPIVLIGWFFINHLGLKAEADPKRSAFFFRMAEVFLLGMSFWFYGYFKLSYLGIMIISILVNFILSALINQLEIKDLLTVFSRKAFLLFGVGFNLGLLFYFKYFDFFTENMNALFHTNRLLRNILLPLGISFFTFQQLSFVIDRSLGKAKHYPFLQYANFVTFFPQLIAGPIVLHDELVPQLQDYSRRKPNADCFVKGLQQFVLGLGKKVLLADALALVVNYGFEKVYYLDTLSALLVMLAYMFELYFDFSGYCDMALGIGSMFNLTLPENFKSPYKAHSLNELWKRWHITLTRFFTTYVYYPLGGSRRGVLRTDINIFIVFLLSGLWHGANWTFVLWGISQGIVIVWDHERNRRRKLRQTSQPEQRHSFLYWFSWLATFLYFMLSLVLFRSDNVTLAVEMYRRIFTPSWTGFVVELAGSLDIAELYILVQAATMKAPAFVSYIHLAGFTLLMIISAFFIHGKNTEEIVSDRKLTNGYCLVLVIIAAWCIVSLSQASTFLYFNF
ncbi:MAG: MBOAT family protein [Lachnospiraceae bacterium]|nr:MBOAT family protein [Lachnospiraceae bacterium]